MTRFFLSFSRTSTSCIKCFPPSSRTSRNRQHRTAGVELAGHIRSTTTNTFTCGSRNATDQSIPEPTCHTVHGLTASSARGRCTTYWRLTSTGSTEAKWGQNHCRGGGDAPETAAERWRDFYQWLCITATRAVASARPSTLLRATGTSTGDHIPGSACASRHQRSSLPPSARPNLTYGELHTTHCPTPHLQQLVELQTRLTTEIRISNSNSSCGRD